MVFKTYLVFVYVIVGDFRSKDVDGEALSEQEIGLVFSEDVDVV